MSRASAHASRSRRLAAILQLLIICAFIVPGGRTFAHEVRPAYLELNPNGVVPTMIVDREKGTQPFKGLRPLY